MQQGWITLHRKILDNFVWEDKPFSRGQAWIDLLLLANHEDKTTLFNGKITEIKRGQKITSIRILSERWGWSNTKVTNFLLQLKREKMIDYKSDTKKTVYNIVNYNDYQEIKEDKNDTKTTLKRHRNDTETKQKHTNNNDNNDNNIIILSNDKIIVNLMQKWNELPNTITKLTALKKDTQRYKMFFQRVNEYGSDKVFQAIEKIKQSPFLLGQNNSGWTITFEWFVKPNNFVKVLEGNYTDKKIPKSNNTKGKYIEPEHILTPEEKAERLKNNHSDTIEFLDNY